MSQDHGKTAVKLTQREVVSYQENGFLIVKDPAVSEMKESLRAAMKGISLKIMSRFEEGEAARVELEDGTLAAIVDWCVDHETDRRISRAFYEMYPNMSEVLASVDNPVFLDIARQIGLVTPIPSTIPVIRIDRPGDVIYSTPTHQDYWFSMISDNSIVFWLPITPLSPDMGPLQGIPGSHKRGPVPFREWESNENLVSVEDYPDKEFVELPVEEDELLMFHQCLIHRSGKNIGHNTRVSLQLRYNDLETLDAFKSVYTLQLSGYVKERQKGLRQD